MAESISHKRTAKRIAKKLNTEYNIGKGPDIITKNEVNEIETPNTVRDGIMQLQGYRRPVYIVGTNEKAVKIALDVTKNTTIGVKNNQNKIRKRSTRKKS